MKNELSVGSVQVQTNEGIAIVTGFADRNIVSGRWSVSIRLAFSLPGNGEKKGEPQREDRACVVEVPQAVQLLVAKLLCQIRSDDNPNFPRKAIVRTSLIPGVVCRDAVEWHEGSSVGVVS